MCFVFKRKTAYEMRISDWSSDVCSSDLRTGDDCERKVSDAAVESELLTLINQIELHTSKPVILKPTREFEARYRIGERLERDLWLVRDLFEPDYAGRPWLLWSANRSRVTEAAKEPLEWEIGRASCRERVCQYV